MKLNASYDGLVWDLSNSIIQLVNKTYQVIKFITLEQ